MHLKIRIDVAGWIRVDKPGAAEWQSVTSDQMTIQIGNLTEPFPGVADVDAMRDYFERGIQSRKGALISCDPFPGAASRVVTIVSKYSARGMAMMYVASVVTIVENQLVELQIVGTEDGFTGVREAMILQELSMTAGQSEKEQLSRNVIPIEWKFDRYHPGTRKGHHSYLLSDDEKYDAAYPNHPLTRVRRSLRRIARTFQVIRLDTPAPPAPPQPLVEQKSGLFSKLRGQFAKPDITSLNLQPPEPTPGNRIEIETVPVVPMAFEEIVRELGPQVANDAIMELAAKKAGIGFPALDVRQKMYRDQRDQEIKKQFDASQAQQQKLKAVAEAGKKLAQESTPEQTRLIVARDCATGKWHTLQEREATALAIFDNQAFFDDFVESRQLSCDPEPVSVSDLYARFPELRSLGVNGITLNRCPRCMDAREVLRMARLPDEATFHLQLATLIAGHRYLTEEKLQATLAESDVGKRREGFMHILWHMDPGNATAHLEMAKIAAAEGDAALLKYSREKLARYAPHLLTSLAE